MTPYITADRVAATIRREMVALTSEAHPQLTNLIVAFAVGFFPDSPIQRRAFIRQCLSSSESNPLCFDFETVPGTLEEMEPLQCCYLYDEYNPCTTDAVWAIHEQGEPFDIISYACDEHLVALLGHESEEPEESSMIFEVCPLKVELPVVTFHDPNADADYYEDAPDSLTEQEARHRSEREQMERDPHYIPKFDRTGPANDPPDYDKEFAEALKRQEFEEKLEQTEFHFEPEAEDLFGAADHDDTLRAGGWYRTESGLYLVVIVAGRGYYLPVEEDLSDDGVFEEGLGTPPPVETEEELLVCEVCGGGGLTREDDYCYGCGHIVCVSCCGRIAGASHVFDDHYPERDLRFVAD